MSDESKIVCCLFTNKTQMAGSCMKDSRQWSDRTDKGLWLLDPATMDSALAVAGICHAMISVIDLADLENPASADHLKLILMSVSSRNIPLDLVATSDPVRTYFWINQNLAEYINDFHQDDDPRIDLPSWWRRRIEVHLSAPREQANERTRSSTVTLFSPEAVKAASYRPRGAN